MSDSTRPMTRAVKRRLEEAARTTNDETYESAPQQERVTVGTTPRETGDTPITSATVIRGAGPEELTTRSSHRRSNDSAKGITTGKKKQHRVTWAMDDAQRGFAACSSTRGHKWCKAGDGRRSNQSKRPVRGAKDSDYDGVRSITKDGTITKHKAKVTMPEADQQTREDCKQQLVQQARDAVNSQWTEKMNGVDRLRSCWKYDDGGGVTEQGSRRVVEDSTNKEGVCNRSVVWHTASTTSDGKIVQQEDQWTNGYDERSDEPNEEGERGEEKDNQVIIVCHPDEELAAMQKVYKSMKDSYKPVFKNLATVEKLDPKQAAANWGIWDKLKTKTMDQLASDPLYLFWMKYKKFWNKEWNKA
ncbi:hypothetical protein GQ600_12439 [Phytophthora cactorum]|nr:hypothetical protein GQ600_12439 [Phytophthora cactorum]